MSTNPQAGLAGWQSLPIEVRDVLHEERRGPMLDAMRAWSRDRTLYGCHEDCAHEALYALLDHLDKVDPLTADALRYGFGRETLEKALQ